MTGNEEDVDKRRCGQALQDGIGLTMEAVNRISLKESLAKSSVVPKTTFDSKGYSRLHLVVHIIGGGGISNDKTLFMNNLIQKTV